MWTWVHVEVHILVMHVMEPRSMVTCLTIKILNCPHFKIIQRLFVALHCVYLKYVFHGKYIYIYIKENFTYYDKKNLFIFNYIKNL